MGSTTDLAADGNGNGNGQIDAADYTVWRDNFGASSSVGASTLVAQDEGLVSSAVVLAIDAQDGVPLLEKVEVMTPRAVHADSDGENSKWRAFALMATEAPRSPWDSRGTAPITARTAALNTDAASRIARETSLLQLFADREVRAFGGTTTIPNSDEDRPQEKRRASSSQDQILFEVAGAAHHKWNIRLKQ